MRLCLILVCGEDEMVKKEQVGADVNFILRHVSICHVVQYWRWRCLDWVVARLAVVERSYWCGVSM